MSKASIILRIQWWGPEIILRTMGAHLLSDPGVFSARAVLGWGFPVDVADMHFHL